MSDITIYSPQSSVLPSGTTDVTLLEMWLYDKSPSTQEEYRRDYAAFCLLCGVALQALTLADAQSYADELVLLGLAPATVARRLKSLKSLLSFAQKTGYIRFNVGSMLKTPKLRKHLSERILTEEQVITLLARETNPRNHCLLKLLYVSGMRVSELCDLSWRDVQPRAIGGQITVFGKGDETRSIVIGVPMWEELLRQRKEGYTPDSPVFVSRGGGRGKAGGPLDPSQVLRIVQRAARCAGITLAVSPHWFRHAHASHALENGASIELVRATLGHASIETTAGYTHARPGESSARYLKV